MQNRTFNLKRLSELLISIFLFLTILYLYVNDKLKILINPRYNIFVLCTEVILFIFIIYMIAGKSGESHSGKRAGLIRSLLMVFVIISMGSISYENFQQNISEKQGFDIDIKAAEDAARGRNEVSANINAENNDINRAESNMIVFEEKDFLQILDNVYDDIDAYVGKPVKITGYVYRLDTLEKNYFIISRLAMYCCEADAVLVGFVCDKRDINYEFKQNEWFEIEGVMMKKLLVLETGKSELPVIEVTSFSKIKRFDSPYVYPYY